MKYTNKNKDLIISIIILLGTPYPVLAKPINLVSGTAQLNLIELFSSEGCSSCPPADEWLASLRSHPSLWKRFIPIEFHVDYWNRLGWTDRFSKESFTLRQRNYAAEWGSWNVYTPGFALNGKEWRPVVGPQSLDLQLGRKVGNLQVSQTGTFQFRITFRPLIAGKHWKASAALLGNGLESRVTAGENSGHTLKHEFVVLFLVSRNMEINSGEYSVTIDLKSPANKNFDSLSVAFWVSRDDQQTPIQVVGADLE